MPSFAELAPPSHILSSVIYAVLVSTVLYGLYLRAFPKPLPDIPYDVKAANSLSGDVKTLRSDPDGLAKWCSRHLSKLGSPVCQVSTPLVMWVKQRLIEF